MKAIRLLHGKGFMGMVDESDFGDYLSSTSEQETIQLNNKFTALKPLKRATHVLVILLTDRTTE